MSVSTGLLSAGAKALGWAARHPVASNAAVGGGIGLVTSGFSGWGALAGGVGGAIGGYRDRGPSRASSLSRGTTAEIGSLRRRLGASRMVMAEARSQLNAVEAGYLGDSIRLSSAREDYREARRTRTRPGRLGVTNRNVADSTLSINAARSELNLARVAMKTSAGDLSRIKGRVGSLRAERRQLGVDLAAAKRRSRQSPSGLSSFRGFRGGAIGGAIGGGAIGLGRLGSAIIGSSYGSQNQNPYGATFSGMGNGTVGGY